MSAAIGILKIFVSTGCRGCKRVLELEDWVRHTMPHLVVEIIDLSLKPDTDCGLVFAVPTHVYNNRPIFLGNPSQQELKDWLDRLDPEV